MATDPDADRVGIAVRDLNGNLVLLNGNQTNALLTFYLLTQWKEKGKLTGKEFMAKTIVTSELLTDMYKQFDVAYENVLTGFKFIADKILLHEGHLSFIGGGEESYGFMVGDFVRDKDAVTSCAMLAEVAAWAADQGKSLFELLLDIYIDYSFYKENLVSIYRHGKEGAEEIDEMMQGFRSNPPSTIDGAKVIEVRDYLFQKAHDLQSGEEYRIDLPKSNVLQFVAENGTMISMRPSGTEPKIKFYFSVNEKLTSREEYEKVNKGLDERIEKIKEELKIK